MHFRFTETAIDTDYARSELLDAGAGGYVSFEGWVRDHNEGQEVTRLEYEAFQELERAYEEKSYTLLFSKVDPKADGLRSDPRFAHVQSKAFAVVAE